LATILITTVKIAHHSSSISNHHLGVYLSKLSFALDSWQFSNRRELSPERRISGTVIGSCFSSRLFLDAWWQRGRRFEIKVTNLCCLGCCLCCTGLTGARWLLREAM
jgi:hypothetical protein